MATAVARTLGRFYSPVAAEDEAEVEYADYLMYGGGGDETGSSPDEVGSNANNGNALFPTDTGATTEHLRVLLLQEDLRYPPCKDYLSAVAEYKREKNAAGAVAVAPDAVPTVDSATDMVSEAWRRKLCEWCFEVVDHFNFDRETVSYALDYLDRVVAVKTDEKREALPKREFQLLAVTSLYMAIKIHGEIDEQEGPRRKLRIGAFVELSRGFFSVQVIEDMESKMLAILKWRVNPPTCLRFIAFLLRLCPKWNSRDYPDHNSHAAVMRNLYDVARYLTELSVCVSTFAFQSKPSVTAYGSILCAIEALRSPLPSDVRAAFLNNMAESANLYPSADNVRRAYSNIKELSPTMFQEDDPLPEFLVEATSQIAVDPPPPARAPQHDIVVEDRVSPVSVAAGVDPGATGSGGDDFYHHHPQGPPFSDDDNDEASPRTGRKRSRPCADEPSSVNRDA